MANATTSGTATGAESRSDDGSPALVRALAREDGLQNLDPEKNRLYRTASDLHPLHWETLSQRDPEEAARGAGAGLEAGEYVLPLLGRVLRVSPGRRTVLFEERPSREVGYQRALVAVAYLSRAQDLPLRGAWVAFRELPGGDSFFRGPHSLPTALLERAFGAAPPGLHPAAARLGGLPAEGADAAAEIPALPRIPLRVLVWAGTEEFPPSAAMLADARAHLFLPLDVLWALANVTASDLLEAIR